MKRRALAVAALALAAHLPALFGDFVWDDRQLIEESDVMKSQRPVLEAFRRDFWELGAVAGGGSGYYRPLVTLTYVLDRAIDGRRPFVYHLTNLLLHAAAVLALLFAARSFGASDAEAAWAAALFAVHPVHLESVAWISGRTDTLCAAFLLSALAARGRSSWALGAAALLAKEQAIVWPVLAALRDRRWVWRERAPELAIVGAVLLLRRMVVGSAVGLPAQIDAVTAGLGSLHLVGLLGAPWLARLEYAIPAERGILVPAALLGAVVVALAAVHARRDARARPWLGAALVALAPSAAILATKHVMGPRLVYTASAFALLAAAPAAAAAWRRTPRAMLVLLAAMSGACAWGSRVWRTNLGFWERAARADRPSPRTFVNLAIAEHDGALLARAWRSLDVALARGPLDQALYMRGLVLSEIGCADLAAHAYREAVGANPRYAAAWSNLGALLGTYGRPHEAADALSRALAAGVDSPEIRANLAGASAARGDDRPLPSCDEADVPAILGSADALDRAALARLRERQLDQAEILVRAALALRPDFAHAHFTGAQIEYARGDFRGAIDEADAALRADPKFHKPLRVRGLARLRAGDAAGGRADLARYLAAHPDDPEAAMLERLATE